jgi:hypothetical protein
MAVKKPLSVPWTATAGPDGIGRRRLGDASSKGGARPLPLAAAGGLALSATDGQRMAAVSGEGEDGGGTGRDEEASSDFDGGGERAAVVAGV